MCEKKNNSIEKRFLKNLFSFIKEHTDKNDQYVLAISGGPDSMVLLDVFQALNKTYPIGFCVANVDHRMRNESSLEQSCLKAHCEEKGIPFFGECVEIKKLKRTLGAKTSLEQLARDERVRILKSIKTAFHAQWIVTAHHQDDLLETFFLRLLRGTGLNGIHTLNRVDGFFLRPLLDYPKESILDYAAKKGLFYFEDHTNEDIRFLRNKIRHRLIPYLKQEYGSKINQVLVRDIENLKNADKVLEKALASKMEQVTINQEVAEMNQDLILQESRAFQREFLLRIYQKWRGTPVGLTAKKLENICARLLKNGDFETTITRSIRFIRSQSKIAFENHDNKESAGRQTPMIFNESFKRKLEKKNVITVKLDGLTPDCLVTFRLLKRDQIGRFTQYTPDNEAYLDFDRLTFPLRIRMWQDGDKMKPLGMKNFKRVSRVMADSGLKKFKKRKQLIMENGKHDIIWCMGLRISEDYKITPSTDSCLKIVYLDSMKDFEGRERLFPQSIDRDEEK